MVEKKEAMLRNAWQVEAAFMRFLRDGADVVTIRKCTRIVNGSYPRPSSAFRLPNTTASASGGANNGSLQDWCSSRVPSSICLDCIEECEEFVSTGVVKSSLQYSKLPMDMSLFVIVWRLLWIRP